MFDMEATKFVQTQDVMLILEPLSPPVVVGLTSLSDTIGGLSRGLHSLDLSQCSLTVKGICRLMDGVKRNDMMANTLHTLNLSGNTFRGEEPSVGHSSL
mgnify:CR=1 FL=1